MMVLHFRSQEVPAMGPFARQVFGVQVARHRRRLHFEEALEAILVASHASYVSAFSMSPICWLTNASSPRSRQNVFFVRGLRRTVRLCLAGCQRSPFFASEIGMGANPRARRTICTASPALPAEITRTTESSKRQRMGRLLPRNASAMLASWGAPHHRSCKWAHRADCPTS